MSRPTESREWPEGDQAGVAAKEGRGKAVAGIQRRGLGRGPAALVTVPLALSILGGIGWTLTRQLVTLADELPQYQHHPALLCIGAVAPGGLSQARHLCKRLRSQCPELKIVVGRWGLHDEKEADRQHLLAAGADHVETTVLDTQRALAQVGLTLGRRAPESPPTPGPEVVPWTTPTTATARERAQGA
jgi:hypothetical protein